MEQILVISASVAKDGRVTLLLNDTTVKLDEDGTGQVDINDLILSEEKNVFEFDRAIESCITDAKKVLLYRLFIKSNRFGISDVSGALNVDKTIARQILWAGFNNDLLVRFDTQWKLDPNKKDQIVQMMKKYEKKEEPDVLDEYMPAKAVDGKKRKEK